MVTDLTPDEQVKRVWSALAEAGYPQAKVCWDEDRQEPSVQLGFDFDMGQVPEEVCWKAMVISRIGSVPCFSCWAIVDLLDLPLCTHEISLSDRKFFL